MNLDNTTIEPIPFDDTDDYTYIDIDYHNSLPPFRMAHESSSLNPHRYKKLTNILSPIEGETEESSDDEDEPVESETPEYGSLDVIAVKQFHQSNMDITSQIYVGSLTILGLFILFRFLRK
uniref:Uncharacterized protein n=1 Tax=viral metagenome TaxID=1070528 RepID=A0A6C0D4H0_9ZZZZ